jgi:hypothetical protein
MEHRLTPAEHVIQIFGGVRATARALDRSPSCVSKWRAPKDARGCDGGIPRKAQEQILRLAKEQGLDITADDLISGRAVK